MIYHYQKYIRIWHMLNALCFLVLILTGLSMQYSNPDSAAIPFSLSVQLHNICGILLSANYLVFFIGNWISGNSKHYRIQWKGEIPRLMKQARYYAFGYFKKEEHPFPLNEDRKFNPLQAFTYAIALYAGVPILIITGFGLLFPETIMSKLFGVSGLVLTDLLHVISGFFLSVFMFIHIYLCTIGSHPLRNFRSIITGWHETH
ncbi:cytochrome b/b6 domain-containing protein [Bacteroidota bacterium]